MRYRILTASADDAVALADIARRTFHDAFAADNEAHNIDDYIEAAFNEQRIREELRDTSNTFLLAYRGGKTLPVGYAKLRVGGVSGHVLPDNSIEIERLYADQPATGQGIGSALMEACLRAAAESGFDNVWLGVWENNAGGIRFYERWGFREFGRKIFYMGTDPQNDLIMAREVGKEGA
jgi:ribosomal protein S18 acetylase RimI-like enzyme